MEYEATNFAPLGTSQWREDLKVVVHPSWIALDEVLTVVGEYIIATPSCDDMRIVIHVLGAIMDGVRDECIDIVIIVSKLIVIAYSSDDLRVVIQSLRIAFDGIIIVVHHEEERDISWVVFVPFGIVLMVANEESFDDIKSLEVASKSSIGIIT